MEGRRLMVVLLFYCFFVVKKNRGFGGVWGGLGAFEFDYLP